MIAPMLLGLQTEFKDHRQDRDPGAATLGSMGAQADGREGQFDGVSGP
jgi:hypothetical protein